MARWPVEDAPPSKPRFYWRFLPTGGSFSSAPFEYFFPPLPTKIFFFLFINLSYWDLRAQSSTIFSTSCFSREASQ